MPKRLIAIIVILLSSYVAYAAKKSDKDAEYVITPQPRDDYEVKDNVIYYRRGEAGMMFELADGNTVSRYYAERGASQLGNPFAQNTDLQKCTIFLVTLINHTNGALTFTPGYVVMKVGDEASFPLDFAMLYSAMEPYPTGVRKILEKSIYHSPEAVRPGEVISKFLFYPALPRKNIDFRLEIDYMYFEDHEIRTKLYYTIRKKKD